jgi:hypothetical protein
MESINYNVQLNLKAFGMLELDFSKGYVKTDQKLQDIISKMLKKYPQRTR